MGAKRINEEVRHNYILTLLHLSLSIDLRNKNSIYLVFIPDTGTSNFKTSSYKKWLIFTLSKVKKSKKSKLIDKNEECLLYNK